MMTVGVREMLGTVDALPDGEGSGFSVLGRLLVQAERQPESVCAMDDRQEITFADLEKRSTLWATALQSRGVRRHDCVALFFDRSVDFIIAAVAVWKCGAAYLPLDPSTPPERGGTILKDSGSRVLMTHRDKANQWNAASLLVDVDRVDVDQIEAGATDVSRFVLNEPAADDLAYVIYTSGSTGTPKGVEITHANLLNLIDWHQEAFGVTSEDRASQVAGFGFDAVVWEIWPHLTAGASVHMADEATRRSPQTLKDWLVKQQINIAFVPTVLAEPLVQNTWPTDTALRIMLTGADVLHRHPIEGLPFVLVNNYGPSECAVVATSGVVAPNQVVDDVRGNLPLIGRPIRNAAVLILDENLRRVSAGEAGELCLAGALVGRGYRNQPELTASRFVTYRDEAGTSQRIYRTGDRARFLSSGEIEFLGRLDQQIKIRGYRIEPGEIVYWLDRYPGVQASAVKATVDEAGGSLAAYVVLSEGAKITAADLRADLATHLPDYMIPTAFVKIEAIPVTANGKLDREALAAPTAQNALASGGSGAAEAVAVESGKAGGDVEAKLAALVASLLKQDSLGREENFFMVGGHSMLGVQLVAQIRETFGVKLALRQLFGTPTVAALSKEISRLMGG